MYVFVYVQVSYPEPVRVPSSFRGYWQIVKRIKSLLKGYLCNSPDTLDRSGVLSAIVTIPGKMIRLCIPSNLSCLHRYFL
jgi:hypothetical protein